MLHLISSHLCTSADLLKKTMSHGPCCRIKGRTHFTSREYLFGHTDTATGQKKHVCLASLLFVDLCVVKLNHSGSWLNLNVGQMFVLMLIYFWCIHVFKRIVEKNLRKFHTFTVFGPILPPRHLSTWPNRKTPVKSMPDAFMGHKSEILENGKCFKVVRKRNTREAHKRGDIRN